jgi:hypothetical protein
MLRTVGNLPRIEVFPEMGSEDGTPTGRWRYRVRRRNGRVTDPSQGYSNKSNAVKAGRKDEPGLPVVTVPPG